jgi:hypothetical protein
MDVSVVLLLPMENEMMTGKHNTIYIACLNICFVFCRCEKCQADTSLSPTALALKLLQAVESFWPLQCVRTLLEIGANPYLQFQSKITGYHKCAFSAAVSVKDTFDLFKTFYEVPKESLHLAVVMGNVFFFENCTCLT